MFFPTLRPEEHLEGYRGRLRFLNGLRDGKAVSIALDDEDAARTGRRSHRLGFVELVAARHEASTHDLLMRHSLWPFSAAADRPISPAAVNAMAGTQAGRTSIMRWARPDAWMCHECVREDIGFWGYSYWRRQHQLPGVLWCDKHGSELAHVHLGAVVSGMPDHFMEVSKVANAELCERARKLGAITRYLEICQGILDSAVYIRRADCAERLAVEAISSGLCTSARGAGAAMFELARATLPSDWLEDVFPKIDWQRRGKVTVMDAVFGHQHYAAPTAAIALAAALLFESSDDALRSLAKVDHGQCLMPTDVADGH